MTDISLTTETKFEQDATRTVELDARPAEWENRSGTLEAKGLPVADYAPAPQRSSSHYVPPRTAIPYGLTFSPSGTGIGLYAGSVSLPSRLISSVCSP
jgi:hypothetical protein